MSDKASPVFETVHRHRVSFYRRWRAGQPKSYGSALNAGPRSGARNQPPWGVDEAGIVTCFACILNHPLNKKRRPHRDDVADAAVPPCFPNLHQGRTAWAAITSGERHRLLDPIYWAFTDAIYPRREKRGEFDLVSGAPQRLPGFHAPRFAGGWSTTPAVMFLILSTDCNIFHMGDSITQCRCPTRWEERNKKYDNIRS